MSVQIFHKGFRTPFVIHHRKFDKIGKGVDKIFGKIALQTRLQFGGMPNRDAVFQIVFVIDLLKQGTKDTSHIHVHDRTIHLVTDLKVSLVIDKERLQIRSTPCCHRVGLPFDQLGTF